MTNVILRVVAWGVQFCFPPSGRHRLALTNAATPASPKPAPRSAQRGVPPQGPAPIADDIASLVRPYLRARERTMQSKPRLTLICPNIVMATVKELA